MAQLSVPLQVDNNPVAPLHYSSNFSGHKLALDISQGSSFEGVSNKIKMAVTNLTHLRFKFPDVELEEDGDIDIDSEWNDEKEKHKYLYDLFLTFNGDIILSKNIADLGFGESYEQEVTVGPMSTLDKNDLSIEFSRTKKDKNKERDYNKNSSNKNFVEMRGRRRIGGLYLNIPVMEDSVAPVFLSVKPDNTVKYARHFPAVNGVLSDSFGRVNPSSLALLLKGTLSDGTTINLNKTNSLVLNTADGGASYTFFSDLGSLAEGKWEMTLDGADYGNNSSLQINRNVQIDRTAPIIFLRQSDNQLTRNSNFILPVIVNDKSPVVINVLHNGSIIFEGKQAIFDANIKLVEGRNHFEIQSIDAAGNVAEPVKLASIELDTNPPSISIMEPLNNSKVKSKEVIISGISNEHISKVEVNGVNLSIGTDKKSFSGTVVFSEEGAAQLNFHVFDLAGNISDKSIDITISKKNAQLTNLNLTNSGLDPERVIVKEIPIENKAFFAAMNNGELINYHYLPISPVVNISDVQNPGGTTLSGKAKLEFDIDLAQLKSDGFLPDFMVYYFNNESQKWQPLQTVVLDEIKKKIIAYTDHFTPFVLTSLPVSSGTTPAAPSCITQDFPLGIGGTGNAIFSTVGIGFKYYQDRNYFIKDSLTTQTTFNNLGLHHSLGIATCNGGSSCGSVNAHKRFTGDNYIDFTAHTDLDLFILYDSRGGTGSGDSSSDAAWISAKGFIDTGMLVETTDAVQFYTVYKKSYNKGEIIQLDGNRKGVVDPSINTNYWVILKPKNVATSSGPGELCANSPDTSAPISISNLKAFPGDNEVLLTWQIPSENDFAGVVIRRSTIAPPASIYEGQAPAGIVISPSGFKDTSALINTTYFYTVFSLDVNNNIKIGQSVIAVTGNDSDNDQLSDSFEDNYINFSGLVSDRNLNDTDGDGIIDGDEHAAGTDPTNGDIVKPVVSLFDLLSPNPAEILDIAFNLDGTDNVGVTEWFISESSSPPRSDDTRWSISKPSNKFLTSGDGPRNLYAWVKDAAGNVSLASFLNFDVKQLTVLDIANDSSHTCFLFSNKKVKCIGLNPYGQLGYGDKNFYGLNTSLASTPYVNIGFDVKKISVSDKGTCALLEPSGMKCWGWSEYGYPEAYLGQYIGDDEVPGDMPVIDLGGDVKDISLNARASCVHMADDSLKCWSPASAKSQLTHVDFLSIPNIYFSSPVVKLGQQGYVNTNKRCVLLADGSVRCWGRCYQDFSPLGLGYCPSTVPFEENFSFSGLEYKVQLERPVIQLEESRYGTCVLFDNFQIKCWGDTNGNNIYSLIYGYGYSEALGNNEIPTSYGTLDFGEPVKQISLGELHACALLFSGDVKCWGNGFLGQLGYGNLNDQGGDGLLYNIPIVPIGEKVNRIFAGWLGTCVETVSDKVKCWGYNLGGNLGLGHSNNIGDDETPDSIPPLLFDISNLKNGNPRISNFTRTSSYTTSSPIVSFSFEAIDDGEISGWIVSEDQSAPSVDDLRWAPNKPTEYILTASEFGPKIIYSWVKDNAGNISPGYVIRLEYLPVNCTTQNVLFQDPVLESAVRKKLGLFLGDISLNALKSLSNLKLIGASNLSGLECAQNITNLTLEGGSFNSFGPIDPLKKLSYLTIENTNFSDNDLPHLAKLDSLWNLKLLNNGVTTFSPSQGFNRLENLALSGPTLSNFNLASILTLKSLSLINVGSMNFSGLSGINSLTHLKISNSSFSNSDFSFLTNIQNKLGALELIDSQISDLSFANLSNYKNLYWLNLEGNPVSDISPVLLLANLRGLKVTSTNISCPNSNILSLVGNGVYVNADPICL